MWNTIRYELRNIFDKKTLLAISCLIMYSIVMACLWYGYYERAIMTSDGEIINNITMYRVLEKETKSVEGTISTDYLNDLVSKYNNSMEKLEMQNYMDTYYNRFKFTNYVFNYAELGLSMNSSYFDLDYEFMNSIEEFDRRYKNTLLTNLIEKSDGSHGMSFTKQYNNKQINILKERIGRLRTDFNLGYNEGWYNIIVAYGQGFVVMLIVIVFCLSSIFSKDSSNGIEEIALSTMYGRNRNMNARLVAGNLFAVIIYLIFLLTLIVVHGSVATLSGLNTSIQSYWYVCYYNITFGVGILIMFLWGLLAVLVVCNAAMLISIKTKYVLLSTSLSIVAVLYLNQIKSSANPIVLQLNPIFYASRLTTSNLVEFDIPHFVGNLLIPYSVITVGITIVYILIINVITRLSFKKYKIN